MKQNIHHPVSTRQSRDGLYYLYYPREFISLCKSGWIIISVLLISTVTLAQESTPGEFTVGSPIKNKLIDFPNLIDTFNTVGFNTIWQRAESFTQGLLKDYNLIALNEYDSTEYIFHYSTAYYSKWEAEYNQESPERVGVKHYDYNNPSTTFGDTATWKGQKCWSTIGLSAPACSLMYGPHYRQEKRYKRWHYGCRIGEGCVTYTPRFRMALDNHGDANSSEDVCKIKVVFRYKDLADSLHHDTTFIERTLKVGDFDTTGEFDDFYLHPNPSEGRYEYWPNFILPDKFMQSVDSSLPIDYTDWESYTGIQFWVEWLRSDTLCDLYIDYAEVYDNKGWNDFIEDPDGTAYKITAYADSFKTMGWDNIIYWTGPDEPFTIDSYMPMHIVDSLIRSDPVNAPPLVVHFDPNWTWDHKINGEDEIEMFYNIAKPEKIIIGMYPPSPNWPTIRFEDFEWLRFNFQRTSAVDPSFWFKAQTFGLRNPDSSWCIWRKPVSSELTSMVMLSLAHGAKGIIFEWFDSMPYNYAPCLNNNIECLVNSSGMPEVNDGDTLYITVKDKLVPRLKGKLGKTLMKLDYMGNYLQLQRKEYEESATPVDVDYLTLSPGIPEDLIYNWHCGLFIDSTSFDDNYFLLANLIITDQKNIRIKVQTPSSYPINYRFRNVEGLFDTTVQTPNYLEKQITHQPGEGYLYEFAPVIKYGGRLLYPESTQPGMTLNDDMIIENGATLTINGNYTAQANIIVRNGSIINGENGKITFMGGVKLIIEGSGSITGTSNNKLHLEFSEPVNDEPTGILIKANSSLTISNCKIESATIGINSLVNANYLNAQYVEFINCETHSINMAGRNPGMNPTPPPQITGCTMLYSNYGIAISNLPGMLIYDNDITNTACGIYLSNVTDAQLIGNTIISNREELEGIFILSSGGAIRTNLITSHTVGLQLANSSPILGSNVITANKFHGLHIGDGSLPYMRMGSFIGNPPNFYATSGYNKIFQNGGFEGEGDDNDGSEIYFVNSNAEMDKGCNSIYDDREPSPPLVNTELLMNCPEWSPIEVDARVNYWGNWVDERRFGWLRVNYIPYSETPCPEPQDGSAGELVRMTSFGDVIDTVYVVDIEIPDLTETEEAYAEAEEYFLTGNLSSALQIYEGIINSTVTEEEKYTAYQRKYSIGKLTGQTIEYFNQLSNTFSALASNTQDTLNKKILNQLSTLSKVGEQEYETAIAEFDNIVQQNPNTEEAVYAEIDALTTALLLEEADSTLQKGRLENI